MTTTEFSNNASLVQTNVAITGGGLIATSSSNQSGITYALWPNNANFPIYAECTIDTIASGLCILFGAQFPVAVLGVCVDATNRKVWFTADGVTWNGNSIGVSNPASNLGGNVIPWSGDIHAGYTFSTVGDWVNFNFGQAPFVLAPPAGASAWGASETIGSADSNLLIGPDGVSVYLATAATYPSCYTTGGKSSGLWYFEMPLIGRAGQSGPGFCAAGHTLIDYLGSDGNSSGCYPWSGNMYGWGTVDGFIASPGSFLNPDLRSTGSECWAPKNDGTASWTNNTTAIGAFGAGNTVGMAFDPPSRQIWFTLDGTTWAGVYGMTANPVTKTNGNVVANGPAMIALTLALSGCQVTLNTTGSFVHSVPSGYVAWDSSGPTPPAAALPAPAGRLQRAFAEFFQETPESGRQALRVGKFPAGAAPSPPSPFSSIRRALLAFFNEPDEPGRQALRVQFKPPPPPPVPGLPFDGVRRLLSLFSAHFDEPVDPGVAIPRRQDKAYGGGANLPARASQVAAEGLVSTAAGVRAGQAVAEGLVRTLAGLRAGQVVGEALWQQNDPTYVRAGQIVVEVLIPLIEAPVIPVYPQLKALTYTYVKREKWSVGRGVASSGREVAVRYWSTPQWEWDLSYDVLGDTGQNVGDTQSDIKLLIGFVNQVSGTYSPFYYLDPDDNTVVGQPIGIGDGLTKQFTFSRTYGENSALGDFNETENVGSVITANTLNIYVDSVLQDPSTYTIDTSTPCNNFVNFVNAHSPGTVITADFSFYYFCRLKDDSHDFAKFMYGMWNLKKITLFSLKG